MRIGEYGESIEFLQPPEELNQKWRIIFGNLLIIAYCCGVAFIGFHLIGGAWGESPFLIWLHVGIIGFFVYIGIRGLFFVYPFRQYQVIEWEKIEISPEGFNIAQKSPPENSEKSKNTTSIFPFSSIRVIYYSTKCYFSHQVGGKEYYVHRFHLGFKTKESVRYIFRPIHYGFHTDKEDGGIPAILDRMGAYSQKPVEQIRFMPKENMKPLVFWIFLTIVFPLICINFTI